MCLSLGLHTGQSSRVPVDSLGLGDWWWLQHTQTVGQQVMMLREAVGLYCHVSDLLVMRLSFLHQNHV